MSDRKWDIDWEARLRRDDLDLFRIAVLAECADQTSEDRDEFRLWVGNEPKIVRALVGMIEQRDELIEEMETTIRTLGRLGGAS